MKFWQLDSPGNALALICAEPADNLNYHALATRADEFIASLPIASYKRLGFVLCRNDVASVTAYLGALRNHDCVALLPDRLSTQALATLIERYTPDWLLHTDPQAEIQGYTRLPWHGKSILIRQNSVSEKRLAIFPDTAVLLSTSGTTGNPKMVRLSYTNIAANAQSIVQYLGLNATERAIASLPIHYSYGLSILNSHLACGAAIALTDEAVTARQFWELFKRAEVTSLAGVPMMWQMLQRLRLERMDLPSLRTLTQAGGRLAPELIAHFSQISTERGWRFFVMYGQTEASPRIAYVPWERLQDKIGAIGIAIPGGELSLSAEGEMIYRGPNVMLGYAENRADLMRGDDLGGVLRTGDLARVDADGIYWLTGRSKRIAKVFGNRVNLDEIEALLESTLHSPAATLDGDDRLQVVLTAGNDEIQTQNLAMELLRTHLSVHPSGLQIRTVPVLPQTSTGKKDYAALRVLFTKV
ncbi:AMP-binding protein [Uliginosibacterium gangwonense]|uniref:AMP-binding protein n=1 Tax=Uliginosibacterium gangwonense TaxID=392736 RepID=UPI0003722EDE|nr:AMP-binding protein [Uliginosibacterium gangwonense]